METAVLETPAIASVTAALPTEPVPHPIPVLPIWNKTIDPTCGMIVFKFGHYSIMPAYHLNIKGRKKTKHEGWIPLYDRMRLLPQNFTHYVALLDALAACRRHYDAASTALIS